MTNSMPKTYSEQWIFILLVALCPLGQVSIDFYSTSLPIIASTLNISGNAVGLITTAYLFAYGIGQITHGVLCDVVGRRRLLLWMLPLYVAATLAPPFCTTVYAIAMARFLQGIAIAAVSVSVKAIAVDIFKGERLTRIISTLTIIWGLSPILAPFFGSVIQSYLGWQWCFYFLGLLGLGLYLMMVILLPETLQLKKSISLNYLFSQYRLILSNKVFWVYMLQVNLAIIGLLTFITQTPDLIQNEYHFTSIDNGVLFIFLSFLFVFGTRLAVIENNRHSVYLMPLIVVVVSLLLFTNAWIKLPVILFLIYSAIIMFVCGNIFPRNLARCMQLFPTSAGLTSGLIGFITLITPAILFSIAALMNLGAFYRFSAVMLVASSACAIGVYLLKHVLHTVKD